MSLVLVLATARGVGADETALAQVEILFTIEELLRRGRREDGERITRDDLSGAGLVVA